MPLIRPRALLEVARLRQDPIDAPRFLDVYGEFVREVLDGKPESGGYRQWMSEVIGWRGGYLRCGSLADVQPRINFSRRLISSIRRHGVRVPIVIWRDSRGIEIDGWHRTVIAAECGFPAIPFRLRQDETLPEELTDAVVSNSSTWTPCAFLFSLIYQAGSWIESQIA